MVKGGINLVSNGNILVKSHPKSIITLASTQGSILKEQKYSKQKRDIVVLQAIRLSDEQCIVEIVYKDDYGKSTK